jgi:glycosyltransferase involved in cell wall biosynthesis
LISPAVYHALKQANVPIVQTIYNFRLLCPNGLFYTHGQICERCKYGNTLHAVHYRCYHKSYVLSALYATTIAVHRLYGTFALIDCFLPPAEFTARKLIEGGIASGDKIRVLPYFLPDPLPNCGSFTQRQSHVIYLGRLSAEKGLWTLLEAVSGMPGVHLKIFGDGPLADPLRAYVTERGLANVEMAGFVAGEDKWDALRAALCVVVPSEWYENSPFTVLESMAAGTPVIASNLGSLSDVVASYKNGLLFKPSDNRDLQDKLTWLIQHRDKALTMGRYGRQVVESNHSAESHYQQLMRIYNEVKN